MLVPKLDLSSPTTSLAPIMDHKIRHRPAMGFDADNDSFWPWFWRKFCFVWIFWNVHVH
jgi:hypothetical protein